MPPYYPVFLDLSERPCVVLGGGEVAERKVRGLLDCQARVTVVSPEATPGIREMAGRGELTWHARKYAAGDLTGAFLAVAATNLRQVNRSIAGEAAQEKVVLNVVDDAPLCDFIAPAIVRRGDVTVALSTGGTSPALARKLRETLECHPVLDYAHLTGILSAARSELKRRGLEVHPDRWQDCISDDLVELVRSGREQDALNVLLRGLADSSGGGEPAAEPAPKSDGTEGSGAAPVPPRSVTT